MKKPEKDIKKELKGMARALLCRLLKNESKVEQTLFLTALTASALFFLLNVIHQIIVGNVAGIVLSFTVEAALLLLVVLLPINDLYFVRKQRSWITVIYATVCILYAVKGFFGVGFIGIVISAIGLVAALAFYGTIVYDQFIIEDTPVKYWLIYGGASYKVLYTFVMLIINCVNGGGVVAVLWSVVGAAADISVILMLLWLFDEFSFARFLLGEIIDGDADVADETEDVEAADETEPVADCDRTEEEVPVEVSDEDGEEENSDDLDGKDVEYVPYVEDEDEPEIEEKAEVEEESEIAEEPEIEEEPEEESKSEEQLEIEEVSVSDEEAEPALETEDVLDDEEYKPYDDISVETYEAEEDENDTIASEELVEETEADDEIELEPAETIEADPEPVEDVAVDPVEEESNEENVVEENLEISPIELKYARFAAENAKPDDTMRVEGMSGDRFDVWVNADTICFLNDLDEAIGGRGVRSAVIPFDDVTGLGADKLADGTECIVLSYSKDGESREIRFTRDSFAAFKRVMESADDGE